MKTKTMDETAALRFWQKVDTSGACWLWTAAKLDRRYGYLRVNGKAVRAHRIAWELQRGPIPPGLRVLHKCDNGLCVNPEHLFLGSQRDNVLDAIAKGRHRPPSHRKLTVQQWADIRASSEPAAILATKFRVDVSHIRRIRRLSGRPDAGAGNRAKTPTPKQMTGASRFAVK